MSDMLCKGYFLRRVLANTSLSTAAPHVKFFSRQLSYKRIRETVKRAHHIKTSPIVIFLVDSVM